MASREGKMPGGDMEIAAVDMIRRTGALEFRFWLSSEDDGLAVFVAAVRHSRAADGHPVPEGGSTTWECAAGMTPLAALLRLCEQLIDGGTCAHCSRPSGFSSDIEAMPMDELVCWQQWDPELKTFRRACE